MPWPWKPDPDQKLIGFLTGTLPKPYASLMTRSSGPPTLVDGANDRRKLERMAADETRSALPLTWAFVVHLRPGAFPKEGLVAGRVEHIVSGRSEHFRSLPEMLAFMGRVPTALEDEAE